MSRLKHYLFPFLLIFLILASYGVHFFYIGFISDDWDLLRQASVIPLWKPLEEHHFSLLIHLIFKGAAQGLLSPLTIHVITALFHFVNCWLIFRVVHEGFSQPQLTAQAAACLFAVNAAGSEALFWCCAMGYVVCTFWALLALDRFLTVLKDPVKLTKRLMLSLVLYQFAAFLSWDWGSVLFPFLAATCLFLPGLTLNARYRVGVILLPLGIFWFSALAFKALIGQSLGYALNTPYTMFLNLVSTPTVTLFPQFSRSFYTELPGLTITFILWGSFIYLCIKRPLARLLGAFYIICLTPPILLGYPQSRYIYISGFPFYTLLVYGIFQLKNSTRTVQTMAIGVLLICNGLWTYQRGTWWQEAFVLSTDIKKAIQKIAENEKRPLLIVNLPERHAPEPVIWMPYVWRCGISQIHSQMTVVATADCPNLSSGGFIPILSRDEILKRFPGKAIYEVCLNQGLQGTKASLIELPQGCTPLASSKGLKKPWIKTRNQLNVVEFEGILKSYHKYYPQRRCPTLWFNEEVLKQIHHDMFHEVWDWAGTYYKGNFRNIGVITSQIQPEMNGFCEEVIGYFEGNTRLTFLEQSARILHKIQQIHPFTNGNGRHARFISGLYLHSLHGTIPKWPERDLLHDSDARQEYFVALKAADNGYFLLLEDFIVKYGGRNPSILDIVENDYFRQHFSAAKRIETIVNLTYFESRYNGFSNQGYYPVPISIRRPLADAAILLIKRNEDKTTPRADVLYQGGQSSIAK